MTRPAITLQVADPDPEQPDLLTFERDGNGQVTSISVGPLAATPAEEEGSQATARLTIDLPAGLHRRFKAACALQGTSMVDEVRQFIEEWLTSRADA